MAEHAYFEGVLTLADIISEELDVLFVGYNPNPYAVAHAHYYARRANRFWEDLHDSGLVPRVLRGSGDDVELLRYGLGVTDVIKRPTPNIDGLNAEEFRRGFKRLDALLHRYRPRVLCFNGLGLGARYQKWGAPPEGILVRALPSTSPRNNGLRSERLQAFCDLKLVVESLRAGIGALAASWNADGHEGLHALTSQHPDA